jgi:hypothetical protein
MRWLEGFKKRNRFSFEKSLCLVRRILENLKKSKMLFLITLNYKPNCIGSETLIYNMDEMPVYCDMMQSRTLSFSVEKIQKLIPQEI